MKSRCEIAGLLEADRAFIHQIDEWVEAATKDFPTSNDLFLRLPGIWPAEVLASVARLDIADRVPKKYFRHLESSLNADGWYVPNLGSEGNFHILEHPLDFEWRFAQAGRSALFAELKSFPLEAPAKVLCLGCPTLFATGKTICPHYDFVLWDKNASLLGQMSESESISQIDSCLSISGLEAAAAVVDPPWYNDFYRSFIWAALRNVRVGGYIVLSFPPEGTRPSAASDFHEIIRWIEVAGAKLVSRQRGTVPYQSPLFEINALKSAGLTSVPFDWRRGDLVTLQKVRAVSMTKPISPAFQTEWEEHRVGSVRVRINHRETISVSATLNAVAATDVLPSVSTRFPRRSDANVVTSGNRFFRVDSPGRIAEFCGSLSGALPIDLLKSDRDFGSFADLVTLEQREASHYFSTTYEF